MQKELIKCWLKIKTKGEKEIGDVPLSRAFKGIPRRSRAFKEPPKNLPKALCQGHSSTFQDHQGPEGLADISPHSVDVNVKARGEKFTHKKFTRQTIHLGHGPVLTNILAKACKS